MGLLLALTVMHPNCLRPGQFSWKENALDVLRKMDDTNSIDVDGCNPFSFFLLAFRSIKQEREVSVVMGHLMLLAILVTASNVTIFSSYEIYSPGATVDNYCLGVVDILILQQISVTVVSFIGGLV
jgi:hypothetical protein